MVTACSDTRSACATSPDAPGRGPGEETGRSHRPHPRPANRSAIIGIGIVVLQHHRHPRSAGPRRRSAGGDVTLIRPLKAAARLPSSSRTPVKACVLAQFGQLAGDVPVDGPFTFVNVFERQVGGGLPSTTSCCAAPAASPAARRPLATCTPLCFVRPTRAAGVPTSAKRAITARYLGAEPSWSGSPAATTVKDVVALARRGEEQALDAAETGYLGRGFAMIVKSIDPARVYVGSAVTLAWGCPARCAERWRSACCARQRDRDHVVPLSRTRAPTSCGALVSTATSPTTGSTASTWPLTNP